MASNTHKYIIMAETVEGSAFVGPFQRSSFQGGGVTALLRRAFSAGAKIPVTSSAVDDVAMLELTDDQARTFEAANGAIKLHPVRTYRLAAIEIDRVLMSAGPYSFGVVPPATNSPFRIRVQGPHGEPVANAAVLVCEWGTNNLLQGKTDATGHATIPTGIGLANFVKITPFADFWGQSKSGVMATHGPVVFTLDALEPTYVDCFKFHYPESHSRQGATQLGRRVKVAVIDTGVDDHPDLGNVIDRISHTQADDADDLGDNGTGHGTHVAGIIGGCGRMRGLAPNAELMSFRVFERDAVEADTLYIFEAVRNAVDRGADVINLSLGQEKVDEVLEEAIKYAERNGVLVVAASGNDGHSASVFPASYPEVVSVAAVGRSGTFPPGSVHAGWPKRVEGTDSNDFVPAFSNHGKVELAAPGVAVISTVGVGGYAAKDGTSMACPVVSGFAAWLLEAAPELSGRVRCPQRLADLKALLYRTCNSLGFDKFDVGNGLPH
ncbi:MULTISPECIES: S8 family serine peptidase [unclassified Burkholderia]|uniref:S8 family peptidase n=1 Tax=unclassified Burkholderia TaxID=2613784 RepID=UPI00197F5E31|nr:MULTISPECIES: S8 family serine peptidase [unclassified Burkholderia]MBN3769275.1 S8 family serine peptidase [Burkholderia sp. Se-20378]MBN3793988.1 S8 family serine peptidase [Burkholderia sp. Ac-20392]